MAKKIVALLTVAVMMRVSGCRSEVKVYNGTVAELLEYEGNYSILVAAENCELITDDMLTIGLNSDMKFYDNDGNEISPDRFVEVSEISFTVTDGTLLLSYPPILRGCTEVRLVK